MQTSNVQKHVKTPPPFEYLGLRRLFLVLDNILNGMDYFYEVVFI